MLADELKTRFPGRISVLHRPRKEGLGRAYVHAFLSLLSTNYEFVVQMDADLSHDPKYLPTLIGRLADYDVVLGSRYLGGVSVVNWDFKRLLLSKMATRYVRAITGIAVSDSTGGFKAWRMSALRSLDLRQVFSQGYLFQIEMTWRAFLQQLRVGETPIVFYERRIGQSKVDLRIISEAAFGVLKLRWKTRSEVQANRDIPRTCQIIRAPRTRQASNAGLRAETAKRAPPATAHRKPIHSGK